ncbi:MAG: ABC transporter ATP-binding protein [candidate division NC10 bacterium]|nr:ABC transporter ATP-binding protein [candidate division NC10 bacterium]
MLRLQSVEAAYGSVRALFGLSLEIREREVVCMIGANGAGKTTTLRVVTGALRPTQGEIQFLGRPIASLRMSEIVRLGISCVPEGRKVFSTMTVQENLEIGGYIRRHDKRWLADTMEQIFTYFPILRDRRTQLAGTLSGGEQQMLALGRAMMSRPKLMLLDEPSMGLAPLMVERTFEAIQNIAKAGTTILLVEQNARMALTVADRGYVVQMGRIVMSDTAGGLLQNDQVRQTYLGIGARKEDP